MEKKKINSIVVTAAIAAALAILAVAIFTNCSWAPTAQRSAELCAGQDSLICDKIGDVYAADLLLQLANLEALRFDAYSREQALSFLDTCEGYLLDFDTSYTGAQVVAYVVERVEWLQDNLGYELYILSQLAPQLDVELPITAFDRQLLLAHIKKQRALVEMFEE